MATVDILMATVDILMATYNGERFVAEQIESILGQTFTDWRLLIRDDGSSDDTPAIIEGYAAKYPDRIEIVHDDAVCKSPQKNFFELLKHAEADYVMFCDQDDVWLKYKVQITLDYMKDVEHENPGKPVMVFTGLQIVDAELKSLGCLMSLDFPEIRYTFRELLPCNCSAGCTQMLNRACYEGVRGLNDAIGIHDWLTSLYASAFGVIVRVPMALILYRQHGGNVLGAGVRLEGGKLRKLLYYLLRVRKSTKYIKNITQSRSKTLSQFRSAYAEKLSAQELHDIDEILTLFSKNMFTRFMAMIKLRGLYYLSHQLRKDMKLLWVLFCNA